VLKTRVLTPRGEVGVRRGQGFCCRSQVPDWRKKSINFDPGWEAETDYCQKTAIIPEPQILLWISSGFFCLLDKQVESYPWLKEVFGGGWDALHTKTGRILLLGLTGDITAKVNLVPLHEMGQRLSLSLPWLGSYAWLIYGFNSKPMILINIPISCGRE